MEKDYSILNLERANCGAKIEEALNRLEGMEIAILNFPMKKLKVIGDCSDDMLEKMNEVAYEIEPGSEIVPYVEKKTVQFEIKNLDFAAHGTDIEEAVKKLDGVESASLDYSTMRMKVTGMISEELITRMNQAADEVCQGVEIVRYSVRGSQRKSRLKEIVEEIEETNALLEARENHSEHHEHDEHEHHHGEHCDCGHDHDEHKHHHDEHCDCGHDHGEHHHDEHEHSDIHVVSSHKHEGYEEYEVTIGGGHS